MAGSTYSSNLKIELMSTGENAGTWGNITNTNLGTALEQAVVGLGNPDFVADADLTITLTNSNAAQAARALVLNVTSAFGSLTTTRELVVPTSQKQYIVQNNTTGGQSITVKTSGGTGITVPNGRKAHLYVDGTNVVQMFDFVDINGGAIDGTTVGAAAASTGAFTNLSASGTLGVTGVATLGVGAVLNTPASVTLTNATGLPISTGVSGLGTGVATFLGTPSSANLAAAVTDETGTGALVFANSPTLVTPALGTPASGVVTNLTGTASININGTVGATTASTGAFTTLAYTGTLTGGTGVINIGSGQLYKDASGNVGIGTTSPLSELTLSSSSNASGRSMISWRQSATESLQNIFPVRGGAGFYLARSFKSSGTTSDQFLSSYGSSINRSAVAVTDNGIQFFADPAATIAVDSVYVPTERMRITSAGNVGIGTSSPTDKVQIASGNLLIGTDSGDAFNADALLRIQDSGAALIQIKAGNTSQGGIVFGDVDDDNRGGVVYDNSNDSLSLSSNNSERMRIDSAGNVGIGTSSPRTLLNIAASTGPTLTLENTSTTVIGTGSYGKVDFYGNDASSGASGVRAQMEAKSSGSSGEAALTFSTATTGAAAAERLRIENTGNVGIGTSSPVGRLSVVGADNSTQAVFGGSTGTTGRGLRIATEERGGTFNLDAILDAQATVGIAGNLVFQTQSIERMRIDSAGNVGIGTGGITVSGQRVTVFDNSASGQIALCRDAGGQRGTLLYGRLNSGTFQETARIGCDSDSASPNNGVLYFYTSNSSGTSTERMRINASGNLLVGTTNTEPATNNVYGVTLGGGNVCEFSRNGLGAIFNRTGNDGEVIRFYRSAVTVGTISVTASATAYNTSSDYRLKHDIQPMTGALAKVAQLKPVTYKWNADDSDGEGFIAHELQEVAPYAVSGEKDGEQMQGVDYGKITPLLTAALQEAIAEIQSLKARVAELEAK